MTMAERKDFSNDVFIDLGGNPLVPEDISMYQPIHLETTELQGSKMNQPLDLHIHARDETNTEPGKKIGFIDGIQSLHQKDRQENPESEKKPNYLSKHSKTNGYHYHNHDNHSTEKIPQSLPCQYSARKWVVLVPFLSCFVYSSLWMFNNNMTNLSLASSGFCLDLQNLPDDKETRCPIHSILYIGLVLILLLLLNLYTCCIASGIVKTEDSSYFLGWKENGKHKLTKRFSNFFYEENLKSSQKWYLNWSGKALRGLQTNFWTFPVTRPGSLEKYFTERFKVSELSLKEEMKYEWKRLQSFGNWPTWAKALPSELAREGFYFTDKDDKVTCFSCDLILSNCRTGKSVAIEHKNLSTACKFLLGQEENVPIIEGGEELSTFDNVTELFTDAPWSSSTGKIHTSTVSPEPADSLSVQTTLEIPQMFLDRMKQETLRSTTYKKWPLKDTVDARLWIRAGFFYLGTESQVRCAFCPVTIKTICPTDDPMEVHRSLNPHCPIVNTIRELLDPHVCVSGTGSLQETASSLGIIEDFPRHPEYSTLESRLNSFSNWNTANHQNARDLAEAGFIHAGRSDCVKCFHCDGGLNWLPGDIPWVEHARCFPRCSHVRLNKGEQFIDTVNEVFPQRIVSGETARTLVTTERSGSVSPISDEMMCVIETGGVSPSSDEMMGIIVTSQSGLARCVIATQESPVQGATVLAVSTRSNYLPTYNLHQDEEAHDEDGHFWI